MRLYIATLLLHELAYYKYWKDHKTQ